MSNIIHVFMLLFKKTIDVETTILYNEKSGVDYMEYPKKKKSITEKIVRLFSHKLHILEKRQGYIFMLLFVLLLMQIGQFFYFQYTLNRPISKPKEKIVYRNNKVLFLGDSITEQYDLDTYFHNDDYINGGMGGNTTGDILNQMKERVYDYNPTKIFLMIGTNDGMTKDLDDNQAIKNIEKIINDIQVMLPNTKLYIESILPVNNSDDEKINHDMVKDRSNHNIKKMNQQIQELCEEYQVTYINLYDKLIDKEGNLKLEYTKEGLHMSDEGYQVITKELKKYL